ncbi:MAG TPA: RNA polymerase sigma factor [Bdellovibrionales bacterium]|nr:RNA polymerase sigma factor [Bdellovibrionales bacterium]
MISDDELMKEVAGGSQKAFAQLFDRHSGKVLGYAMRLLGGDQIRAEDISQMAWMKVIKAAPSYKGSSSFVAWAYTIVRNTAFNELRAKRRRQEETLTEAVAESVTVASIETVISETADVSALKKRIDELPEMQRAVLVAYMTEELSYDEIASQLDISVSSVKSLLFRARQNLATALKEEA